METQEVKLGKQQLEPLHGKGDGKKKINPTGSLPNIRQNTW